MSANFIFEHMDDMPRVIEGIRQAQEAAAADVAAQEAAAARRNRLRQGDPGSEGGLPGRANLGQQLADIGIPAEWAEAALSGTQQGLDPNVMLRMLLQQSSGGAGGGGPPDLSALLAGMRGGGAAVRAAPEPVISVPKLPPLNSNTNLSRMRIVSGNATVSADDLTVSVGASTRGFPTVSTTGILLSSGRWYYEALLLSGKCIQVGLVDAGTRNFIVLLRL